MNRYYLFVCILLGEFMINHINEKLLVYLQINAVCLYVPANERIIQTNANIYVSSIDACMHLQKRKEA